ncbi:hypothetical protein SESBI_41366 [Sesbania bispinosa]|nr:hypothetical protein SESBI_41366 [Sesbania bispinosa]
MPEFCVTGGTGFIAAYLVKTLLQNGHTVRTTVRNPEDVEKVGFLTELSGAQERLKILKANLLNEGSFDEAVTGVDGVFHTASPATLIEPCIKGILNVLNSCVKAKVKRVVLTSSCSSIRYRDDMQQVSPLNESHWSDPEYCKHYNEKREAWKIAKESGMDLVVVNPSFVVGPLLAPQPSSTLLLILGIIKGLRGEYPNTTVGFVHIDDVIGAHLLAMEESKASGRCSNQEGDNNTHSMDTTKITQLGFPPFKTLEQMFDDCIKSFQDKGFL